MEKTEIINSLYSIRAGLSVISENYDEMKKVQQDAEERKENLLYQKRMQNDKQNEFSRLDRTESRLRNEREQLAQQCKVYAGQIKNHPAFDEITGRVQAQQAAERNCNVCFFPFDSLFINLLFWFGSFVLGLILFVYIKNLIIPDSYIVLSNPVDCLVFILTLSLYPVFLVIRYRVLCKRKKAKLTAEFLEESRKQHDNILEKLKTEKAAVDLKIKKIDGELETITTNKLRLETNTRNLEPLEKNTYLACVSAQRTINSRMAENEKVKQSLINSYENVLSVSDWENIDLIIYYLSTNRADTMKEALQMVDAQRRTDAIIQAIHSAGASIANTIQRGFASLESSLSRHFVDLSMQIQNMSQSVDGLSKEVAAHTEAINGNVSKLIDSNRIQSAFLAKATKSVNELVRDMHDSEIKITVKTE